MARGGVVRLRSRREFHGKQKRRSTGQGAKKPLDPQRPEKNMGPSWRQRPRTFAPQASVMAAGVREDVGHEYTCFMRGGEDARLHGRFSGWLFRMMILAWYPCSLSVHAL